MSDILIWFIIGIIAGAIGVALDTHRKKRLGIKDEPIVPKAKKYKADWVSDENYENSSRRATATISGMRTTDVGTTTTTRRPTTAMTSMPRTRNATEC